MNPRKKAFHIPKWGRILPYLLFFVLAITLVAVPIVSVAGKNAENGDPPELSRAVLTPDDFEFIGAFTLPNSQPDPQTRYWLSGYSGLTHRYVDGQFKLYTVPGPYPQPAPSGHLIEIEVPGNLSLTLPYPRQTVYQSFGDIYQDKITQTAADGDNPTGISPGNPGIGLSGIKTMIDGIFWDETDQRLYWTKVTRYDTGSSPDTALGYAVLDDSTHTGTGVGSWIIPSNTGRRWSFSMTAIPDWFAGKYLDGRRLGVGFGGSGVSITTNGVSIGPALFAIKPPDPALEPHMSELTTPSVPLISHIFGKELPARRNASMPLLRVGNEGDLFSFGNDGAHSRSGVWIDGDNRHGLLVFTSLPCGATDAKIVSSISPMSIELDDIGDIMPGDLLRVNTDWTGSKGYQSELLTVSSVLGNVVTFGESLKGNPILEDHIAEVTWPDGTKSTVNYENRVVCGGWYSGGGPRFSRVYNAWYIYDPADLAKVAQGSLQRDLIRPLFDGRVDIPNVQYPMPGAEGCRIVLDATFDDKTDRLYILDNTNTIYVYQFHDEPADGYVRPPSPDPATDILTAGNCGDRGSNVQWTLYRDGRLEIYGDGCMCENPFSLYKSYIESVVIMDGVTCIGNNAFGGCTVLTGVTISGSVREIGAFAFTNCVGLTEFDAPGVISVHTQAFKGCSNLERLRLGSETAPGGVTGSLDNYNVFYGCDKLTDVYLGEGITRIGREFSNKSFMQSIRLPGTLESTTAFALWNCVSLTEIVIPEGITTISSDTFDGCKSLAAVTFPASLTDVGERAFRNNYSLRTLTFKGVVAPELKSRAFENIPNSGTVYFPGGGAVNYTADYFNTATSGGKQFNGWIFEVANDDDTFIAVTDITGVPEAAISGTALTLTGTIAPADATNQTITWSVKNAGVTGAEINNGALYTTAAGSVTVTATVINGLTATENYTKDFVITVAATSNPIVPDSIAVTTHAKKDYFVGESLDLTGLVVSALYSDGSTADVTDSIVTDVANGAALNTAGKQVIKVSLMEGGKAIAETFFIITVSPASVRTYTVTFDVDGKTLTAVVNDGETVAQPTDPVYVFDGWRLGSITGARYDFGTPVTGNLKLYAVWKEIAY